MAEGDSISLLSPVGYTGIYSLARPTLRFIDTAVAGSGVRTLIDRAPADLARNPAVITVLIGANDLGGDDTAEEYIALLWQYVATLKASGAKVALSTVLPTYWADYPQITTRHNTKRIAVNAAIRAAVGTRIDAVIDYAADSDIGTDAAATNRIWYQDGIHPTELGQARMAIIYAPVVDRLLGR